ncbi:Heavy metal transport/detoxification superfamily protein [Abeliophyllum distichum]|uniref:Heavy metal transport/detoxification superfamily protein n=1 Tax=Abeliophyllum distichum TaxID=126358 RepID=A0ABD1TI37_9LAMI
MSPEVSPPTSKRNRINVEAKSVETNNIQLELMDKITQNIDKLTRSIDSIDNSEPSCWNIIREIPNLDDSARFKALDLFNTRAKKFEFMKITSEERSKWITHKLMH